MRGAAMGLVCLSTVAFWGFVFWVADAFGTWELALVVGGGLVLVGVWVRWELSHAMADPADVPVYVPSDWEWPAEDVSSVRHGGLGR